MQRSHFSPWNAYKEKLLTLLKAACHLRKFMWNTRLMGSLISVALVDVVSTFFQTLDVCHNLTSRNILLPCKGGFYQVIIIGFSWKIMHWQKFFKWRLNEPRTCVRSLGELNQLTIIDRLIWSHARLCVHVKIIQILKFTNDAFSSIQLWFLGHDEMKLSLKI